MQYSIWWNGALAKKNNPSPKKALFISLDLDFVHNHSNLILDGLLAVFCKSELNKVYEV